MMLLVDNVENRALSAETADGNVAGTVCSKGKEVRNVHGELNESELYKELGLLTKNKDKWAGSISYVLSLLAHESVKIQAKALWLLGEMGLEYPLKVQDAVSVIVSFCDSAEPLLRERAINALG